MKEHVEKSKNLVFYCVVLITMLVLFFINVSLLFDGFPGDFIRNNQTSSAIKDKSQISTTQNRNNSALENMKKNRLNTQTENKSLRETQQSNLPSQPNKEMSL